MQEQFDISVVIPSFNREKTIKRCIDSIIAQSYPAYEIIVVDDGSTDRTLEILAEEYADKVIVIQQNHRGAQTARNAGIRAARGDYIAFLDSDDEWRPDKLEIQVKELGINPKAVVCGNGYVQRDWKRGMPEVYRSEAKGMTQVAAGSRRLFKMNGKTGYVYRNILHESFCMFQALLTSKENLMKIGLLDERVPSFQEWDTGIRLAETNEFRYIRKPLFVYHLHDGETISKDAKKYIDGMEYITEKYKDEIVNELGKKNLALRYKSIMHKCLQYKDKRAFKFLIKYLKSR